MKFVDAHWEKRNFGFKVCEIIFDNNDTIQDFYSLKGIAEFKYIVVKVSKGNIKLIHELENEGFRYLENQLSIVLNTNAYTTMDMKWVKRFNDVSYRKIESEADLDYFINETKENLFQNDRFSKDPLINKKAADMRISNWVKDIIQQGNSNIFLLQQGALIPGFFILNRENVNTTFVEMAGVFRKFRNNGYAFPMFYNMLVATNQQRIKTLKASMSTNNLDIINTVSRFVTLKIISNQIILRKFVDRVDDAY